ncbi:MAG: hypothetical protein Q8K60_07380 [Parachlamydiaceae bacterium]|nr:hypothetical protein [Parachlamydiaceae bacterium]
MLALQNLEMKFPELKNRHFYAIDQEFNRPQIELNLMINYFKKSILNENEKEKIYRDLFQTDDPTKEYDVLRELNIIKSLLEQVKPVNNAQYPNEEGFLPHLNRIMGPNEILSQTFKELHNEINLNTHVKEGLKVLGWIIPKSLLATQDPVEKNHLSILFSIAKLANIQIYTRKSLGLS